MKQQVVIIDDRAKWIKQEDKRYVCQNFCRLSRKCSSNFGYTCTKFGGDNIPVFSGKK